MFIIQANDEELKFATLSGSAKSSKPKTRVKASEAPQGPSMRKIRVNNIVKKRDTASSIEINAPMNASNSDIMSPNSPDS